MRIAVLGLATVIVAAAAGAVLSHTSWPQLSELTSSQAGRDEEAKAPAAKEADDEPAGKERAGAAPAGEKSLVAISPDQIVAQKIVTATIETGSIDRRLAVPGTIATDAARVAHVPARVIGIVSEMHKLLGSDVKAGEVVSVLDSREVADAKSDYLAARVQADLQRTVFERQQKLLDIKAIAVVQLDQTRAAYREAQLRVDLARQKLSALDLDAADVAAAAKRDESTPTRSTLRRYELRSPIGGRVVERKVDVGTAVGREGEPADLYTIADLTVLWVEVAVPISALPSIKEGAPMTILAGGDEPRRGEARVIFVSPLLNPETRTARVIAALPNPDLEWRPGTFVSAEIQMPRPAAGLLVPRSAVQRLDGTTKVFVRVANGFEARQVRLGAGDDKSWQVVSGLAKGERVAVANSFLLKAELGKSDVDGD